MNPLGLFHFRQTRVLDPYGRHVRHHGEQAEIVLGELLDEVRRVQIDEPDDAIVGLQRDGQHAANLLLHDAHAIGERLIQAGVAHQQRGFLLDDAVAHRVADAKTFAQRRLHHQFLAFQRHQHATRGAHGFHREIHDELEKLRQRHVPGQFASGANERAHLRTTFNLLLLAEYAFEAGGDRGGNGSGGSKAFDEDDGVVRRPEAANSRRNPAQCARPLRDRSCRADRRW